jgi:hypothetical protein
MQRNNIVKTDVAQLSYSLCPRNIVVVAFKMQNIMESKRPYYPCPSIHPHSHRHLALLPLIAMFPSRRHCTCP